MKGVVGKLIQGHTEVKGSDLIICKIHVNNQHTQTNQQHPDNHSEDPNNHTERDHATEDAMSLFQVSEHEAVSLSLYVCHDNKMNQMVLMDICEEMTVFMSSVFV